VANCVRHFHEIFLFVMTLKNHMHRFLYECPICKTIYKSRSGIIHHIKKFHRNITISDCKRISTRTYEYIEIKAEDDD